MSFLVESKALLAYLYVSIGLKLNVFVNTGA